nr:hypothetical protein [Streptomyces sp. NRRL F-4474]
MHTVDLSALTTPGTYRLTLTGTAAGTSPPFRVASATDLITPWSSRTSDSSRPSATARRSCPACCVASPRT